METWPNFFIAGAPRSGTTALHTYLQQIPSIFMSKVKEPHYFVNPKLLYLPVEHPFDKKKYLDLFKDVKDETAIGESSTSYLWDPDSANLICKTVPNARIILILRNPVRRTFSHYLSRCFIGLENRSFHDVIREKNANPYPYAYYLNRGLYSKNVQRFFETFGKDKVKIIIFEEFVKNPKEALADIIKFLGVEAKIPDSIGKMINESMLPRGKIAEFILKRVSFKQKKNTLPKFFTNPIKKILTTNAKQEKISAEDEILLKDFFRDDVIKLQKILNRSLPWNFGATKN